MVLTPPWEVSGIDPGARGGWGGWYTGAMRQRVLMIALATAAAGAILAATLLAPSPGSEDADEPRVLDPGDVNTALDLDAPDVSRGVPIESVDRGVFDRAEADKIVRVTWDRATPLPQGRSRVERPRAVILFPGGRVLEVTAEEGQFVAPDNQPTSGVFIGDVVVTLRDTDPAQPVDFEDESTVEARVFIDGEARFDLVLNQIESSDRVYLTGPRIEFVGTGLDLNYNERRSRLERLSIGRGERLRLKPRPGGDREAEAQPDAGGADEAQAAAGEAPASEAASAETTYYRARFEDDVRIDAPARDAELLGDAFELVFAMSGGSLSNDHPGREGLSRGSGSPPLGGGLSVSAGRRESHGRAPRPARPRGVGRASPAAWHWAFEPPTPRDPRSLFVPGEGDLLVRWTGRLTVLPFVPADESLLDDTPFASEGDTGPGEGEPETDAPPAGLAGPDDVLLTLTGQPATIVGSDGRRIEAAAIDYLGSTGRVRAEADASRPLTLTAPELGTLTGRWLVYDARAPRRGRRRARGRVGFGRSRGV